MNHYVYLTTNLVNGKKYIGKRSCQCPIEEDSYLGSGKALRKAIDQYGPENFSKEILKICSTEDEAYRYEAEMISKYNAKESRDFYNLDGRGRGTGTEKIIHSMEGSTPLKLVRGSLRRLILKERKIQCSG